MGTKILFSDSKVASTAANFPPLKHAFEYSGADFAANTLTDSVGGVVATFTSITDETTGFRAISQASSGLTGTLSSPGTTDWLFVMVFPVIKASTTGVAFGNADFGDAGGGIGFSPDGTTYGYATSNGTAYVTNGATTVSGSDAANACGATFADIAGNDTTAYYYDAGLSAVKTASGTPTGDISGGISAVSQRLTINTGNTGICAGIYIFEFSQGAPDDIAQAVGWMGHNPGFIWPAWKNRT